MHILKPLQATRDVAESGLHVIREECINHRHWIEMRLDALQPVWWEAIFGFLDSVRRHRYRRFEKQYGRAAPPYTGDLSAIEDDLRSRRSAVDDRESQAVATHTAAAVAFSMAEQDCKLQSDQFISICQRWHGLVRLLGDGRSMTTARSKPAVPPNSSLLEPRKSKACRSAVLSEPWRDSMLPFSCDSPGLLREGRIP